MSNLNGPTVKAWGKDVRKRDEIFFLVSELPLVRITKSGSDPLPTFLDAQKRKTFFLDAILGLSWKL
jgi:hypothetical protein